MVLQCYYSQPSEIVELCVLGWCCTVIALLLHLLTQVKGKYISNTSGWKQGHGN